MNWKMNRNSTMNWKIGRKELPLNYRTFSLKRLTNCSPKKQQFWLCFQTLNNPSIHHSVTLLLQEIIFTATDSIPKSITPRQFIRLIRRFNWIFCSEYSPLSEFQPYLHWTCKKRLSSMAFSLVIVQLN